MQKNASNLSPAASQIRTLEKKNEQPKKPSDNNSPVGKNTKWKSGMNVSARGRGGQNRSKNMGNRGESSFRPNNRNYFQSNVKLPRLQDIPRGTCVKCLSTQHVTQACNIYPQRQFVIWFAW